MWSRGAVVALREIWKGRVWKARAWIVVRDRPDELVLWIPQGSPTKVPPGSGIPRDDWTLEDGTFFSDALRIAAPGEAHSILLFFEQGVFRHWYVNLERPLRRSHVGFDYLDQELDVRIDPYIARAYDTDPSRPPRRAQDLRPHAVPPNGVWRLEDEDELEEAQRLGVLSREEAEEVRAEARRVIERWPFPTGWEDWSPDPSWPLPRLPDGWDVP